MKGCCLGTIGLFLFLAALGALVVGLLGWAFWSGARQAWDPPRPGSEPARAAQPAPQLMGTPRHSEKRR